MLRQVRNRLDGRIYAVKKIKLDPKDEEFNRRIIREVTLLSQLHHEYVVRYYQVCACVICRKSYVCVRSDADPPRGN
jgi:serine/threonine protein kinase